MDKEILTEVTVDDALMKGRTSEFVKNLKPTDFILCRECPALGCLKKKEIPGEGSQDTEVSLHR